LVFQRVIDVGAIGQEYIGKGELVLVPKVCLERDFLSKRSHGLLLLCHNLILDLVVGRLRNDPQINSFSDIF
jgi:hypothetical protein